MKKNYIRFIDPHYNVLFRLPDGGSIRIQGDGRDISKVCLYIDENHTMVGSSVFHIREFAEYLDRNGLTNLFKGGKAHGFNRGMKALP